MAHTLRITDSTTTVDLSSYILAYTPMAPESASLSLGDTSSRVTESISTDIVGANIAAAQATIRQLEAFFEQARRFQQSERGARIWLEFDPGATGTVYRAEILDGKLDVHKDALGWMFVAAEVEATLTITRRAGWHAASETELTTAGGVNLANTDDGSRDNFVDIAAANIAGVDRVPIRLEIKNSYNVVANLGTVFVGVNAFKGSAMPTHILEGESATGMTSNADANSSAGAYGSKVFAGSTETLAATWTLSASDLNKLAGHKYHLVMRAPSSNSGIYVIARACYTGTTTALAETQEVLLSANALTDLGVLQLPPYLESETDLYAIDLLLYVRKSGGATFYCDSVMLMPADCWRVYRPLSVGVPYNATLKDEAITQRTWVEGISGTARVASYVAEGEPLQLYAGRDNCIVIVAMNASNACEIARTFNVKVYARPTKMTL